MVLTLLVQMLYNESVGKQKSDNQFIKEIKKFERENPSIKKAMKTLEMSMKEYEQTLRSMDPVVTFTSGSTTILNNHGKLV